MVYGRSGVFDAERMIDMLQALEKFVAVRDMGDGSAFKVDGLRGSVDLGNAGDMPGTRELKLATSVIKPSTAVSATGNEATINTASAKAKLTLADSGQSSPDAFAAADNGRTREAFTFFFSKDGDVFRAFLLDELAGAADALSREAANALVIRLGLARMPAPPILGAHLLRDLPSALAPPLSESDEQVVENIRKLVTFFLGGVPPAEILTSAGSAESIRKAQALVPVLLDNQEDMRRFGLQILGRLAELQTKRVFGFVRKQVKTL